MTDLTHFSLFTGIGGIDIAAEWANFRTVGQVEKAEYPYKILCKHFPEVPKWRDVKDVTSGSVREQGIKHITLLSGGFPCQPFSIAGKRRGKEDPRFLWNEMLRLVSELKPTWILGENVAGIISMELDNCITDLEGQDYSCRAFLLPACAVSAPHRRDRIFIVAHTNRNRDNTNRREIPTEDRIQETNREEMGTGVFDRTIVTNTTGKRRSRGGTTLKLTDMVEILEGREPKYYKTLPTPTARDYKDGRKPDTLKNAGRTENNSLCDKVGANSGMHLNPEWVEWLMGFPIGWTELNV